MSKPEVQKALKRNLSKALNSFPKSGTIIL